MDRIDPLYFAVSNRIDVSEETRIKATSEEAGQWAEGNKGNGTLLDLGNQLALNLWDSCNTKLHL